MGQRVLLPCPDTSLPLYSAHKGTMGFTVPAQGVSYESNKEQASRASSFELHNKLGSDKMAPLEGRWENVSVYPAPAAASAVSENTGAWGEGVGKPGAGGRGLGSYCLICTVSVLKDGKSSGDGGW